MDPKVVTTILNLLDAKYGQEIVAGKRAPLTITRGKKHDYLGILLDYSKRGYVKLDMTAYLKKFFHATVAKLLFLCKRGRPDIQTAIAFLCTRVRHPTKHDYNKLSRVIKYLRHTKDLVLRLSAENLNIIKWWTDASYGVHHDMRSHTGGVMSMGTGAAYSTSRVTIRE
jgi:hypothetical protein